MSIKVVVTKVICDEYRNKYMVDTGDYVPKSIKSSYNLKDFPKEIREYLLKNYCPDNEGKIEWSPVAWPLDFYTEDGTRVFKKLREFPNVAPLELHDATFLINNERLNYILQQEKSNKPKVIGKLPWWRRIFK